MISVPIEKFCAYDVIPLAEDQLHSFSRGSAFAVKDDSHARSAVIKVGNQLETEFWNQTI